MSVRCAAPFVGADARCASILCGCKSTVRCPLRGCKRAAPLPPWGQMKAAALFVGADSRCAAPLVGALGPPLPARVSARSPAPLPHEHRSEHSAQRSAAGEERAGAERSVPGPRRRPRGAAIGSGAGPGEAAAAAQPRALSAAALPRHVAEESGTEQRRRLRALRRAAPPRRRRPAELRARSGAAPERRRYVRAALAEQQRRVLRPRLQGARGCGERDCRGGAGRAGAKHGVPGDIGGGSRAVPCRAITNRTVPCRAVPSRAVQSAAAPPAAAGEVPRGWGGRGAPTVVPSPPHTPCRGRPLPAAIPYPTPAGLSPTTRHRAVGPAALQEAPCKALHQRASAQLLQVVIDGFLLGLVTITFCSLFTKIKNWVINQGDGSLASHWICSACC